MLVRWSDENMVPLAKQATFGSQSYAGVSRVYLASVGLGERTAFEIAGRRPVVRAASLHPEPDVKTTIKSTVSFGPISFDIAVMLT